MQVKVENAQIWSGFSVKSDKDSARPINDENTLEYYEKAPGRIDLLFPDICAEISTGQIIENTRMDKRITSLYNQTNVPVK